MDDREHHLTTILAKFTKRSTFFFYRNFPGPCFPSKLSCRILILLFFFISSNIYSQEAEAIDSIRSIVKLKKGLEKWEPLYELGLHYIGIQDYPMSSTYLDSCLNLALSFGDSLKIVRSTRVKSYLLGKSGHLDKQIELLEILLPIMEKKGFTTDYLLAINSLGNAYIFKGDYDRALQVHFKSLDLRKATGDSLNISRSLQNIGLVYYKLRNTDKALMHYREALRIQKTMTIRHSEEISQILLNLSLCYINKKDLATAQQLVDEAYNQCNERCQLNKSIDFNFNQGIIAMNLNDPDKAIHFFEKSYRVSKEKKDLRMQLDNAIYLAENYLKIKKYDHALSLMNEATLDTKSMAGHFISERLNLYLKYVKLFKSMNNYQKEMFYQQKYINLSDSSYNLNFTAKLMQTELTHLQADHEKMFATKREIIALKETTINQQYAIAVFVILLLLSLVGVVVVLYKNFKLKKSMSEALQEGVRDKTHDLEMYHLAFMNSSRERNNLESKVKDNLNSFLSSIQGVCGVALKLKDQRELLDLIVLMKRDCVTFKKSVKNMNKIINAKKSYR